MSRAAWLVVFARLATSCSLAEFRDPPGSDGASGGAAASSGGGGLDVGGGSASAGGGAGQGGAGQGQAGGGGNLPISCDDKPCGSACSDGDKLQGFCSGGVCGRTYPVTGCQGWAPCGALDACGAACSSCDPSVAGCTPVPGGVCTVAASPGGIVCGYPPAACD